MLGRSFRDVVDDEADIEPQLGCFDAGADAPLAFPGFCGVVCLRVASQDRRLFHRAAGADVIGLNFEGGGEKLVARQAEDVIETIVSHQSITSRRPQWLSPRMVILVVGQCVRMRRTIRRRWPRTSCRTASCRAAG